MIFFFLKNNRIIILMSFFFFFFSIRIIDIREKIIIKYYFLMTDQKVVSLLKIVSPTRNEIVFYI